MKGIYGFILALAFSSQALAATLTTCNVNDVTIEGTAADSCQGMFSGNVNSLEDINAATGGSYDLMSTDAAFGAGVFSFTDTIGDTVALALKQSTLWAVFIFDLTTRDTGADGIWNGTWNTSTLTWDNNSRVRGCQGCGGLSHGMIAGMSISEVPVPGTLSLLGLGLLGLGAVRRQVSV